MTEEVIQDLQKRLALVEHILMTPVVTRKDIKLFTYFAFAITVIGLVMLLGEFYLMSEINHVYALLE